MTGSAPIATTHMTRELAAASTQPTEGWHCAHFFYLWDRGELARMSAAQRQEGAYELELLLASDALLATQRLQVSVVSGHRADFALMLMDPDPLRIDAVHQGILASALGAALRGVYSFVSMSEVSEYVPTPAQFGARLVAEGLEVESPTYLSKLKAYTEREVEMRNQRLWPTFPDWPVTCFYPMNKKRDVGANWFSLPFEKRAELMSVHGRSGMAFAGRVAQLITVAVGLDDWEWGVTLWGRNPQYLKEIVYRMRFDEASALYADFGPFYVSYPCAVRRMLEHCRVAIA